jgi:hypothetical protein
VLESDLVGHEAVVRRQLGVLDRTAQPFPDRLAEGTDHRVHVVSAPEGLVGDDLLDGQLLELHAAVAAQFVIGQEGRLGGGPHLRHLFDAVRLERERKTALRRARPDLRVELCVDPRVLQVDHEASSPFVNKRRGQQTVGAPVKPPRCGVCHGA